MTKFSPIPVRTNSGVSYLDYCDFSGAASEASPGHIVPTHILLDSSGNFISSSNPLQVGGTINTVSFNPATIYAGTQTASLSATALPSQNLVNGVVLKAPSSNSGAIFVGPSGSVVFPLNPGESISYAVSNLSAIEMLGANATDILTFTGN
jgi:hypothetical protein